MAHVGGAPGILHGIQLYFTRFFFKSSGRTGRYTTGHVQRTYYLILSVRL